MKTAKKKSFIGRREQIELLNKLYQSDKSEIAVIYGRRRVGKSTLVQHFIRNEICLYFEGLENQNTKEQIENIKKDFIRQTQDSLVHKMQFNSWNDIFDYITHYLKNSRKKVILFFDEFQWMTVGRTSLVSILKKYWDQEWSKESCLVILCGSISSYMVNKVIRSSALYGRISKEINVRSLEPELTGKLLSPKRDSDEIVIYNLVLGGIPKYWEEINTSKSAIQNVNDLYLTNSGYLFNDYEKVFYSQFKEHEVYERIVKTVCN
jgi:AAA+ ATPase superfamily predicted ATPase